MLIGLLGRKEALDVRLSALVDDYAEGALSKAEFKRAKARGEGALEEVTTQINRMHKSEIVRDLASGSVREWWERQSDGWRRQLMSLLTEHIDVRKGVTQAVILVDGRTFRFDPSLITSSGRSSRRSIGSRGR